MSEHEKIAVLSNEVEARLIDAILDEQKIPHFVYSYHDLAWDGMFQVSRGWGHVEAPIEYREEIMAMLAELRQPAEPEDNFSDLSDEDAAE